ncbi:MAG: 2OG-Fe(II) oxygenase [Cyanobacteria bacterium J06600_6]
MLNNQSQNFPVEHKIQPTILANTLDSLVAKSQTVLDDILNDNNVSTAEKADVALRILQIAADKEKSDRLTNNLDKRSTVSKKEVKAKPLTIVASEREKVRAIVNTNLELSNPESKFYSAQYWQVDNFLSSEEYEGVLGTALDKQAEFKHSQTVTKKDRYRQSLVLPGKYFSDVYYALKGKIIDTLPSALSNLDHPDFFISHVEMQMTAHNDGCFYKVHSDAGSVKTKTRELTYIYYFYRQPKAFMGGELKIYDTEMQDNKIIQKENSKIVEPRNNSIVFFNSRCKHEVLPISCTSGKFEDSRFTLNGWLRR